MKSLSITFLFYLLSIISLSQENNLISIKTKSFIDSTYNALLKKNKVVGASIAIVENGVVVYATGYGFADKENQIAADENTVYRIGSATKSFTDLGIMQLQEQNKLNINNSIKDYLTDLKIESRFDDHNKFLIRDVMTHTSGLPSDIYNGFFCDSPPDEKWVINELNKQKTIAPSNTILAYSNVGYGMLGEVIARSSNLSYSEYIKQHIFDPLGMNSSYIDLDTARSKHFSKGYLVDKHYVEPLIRDQAAGLIHSSVNDMANYITMYLANGTYNGNTIASEASIAEMQKNHLSNTLLSSSSNWGFGLYSSEMNVKKESDSSVVTITGHGGDTYFYHTDFAFVPELNMGVVILTNTDKGTSINSAKKLIRMYLEQEKNYKVDFKDTGREAYLDSVSFKKTRDISIDGSYFFQSVRLDVKQGKKIKMKQGITTIKFIPEDKVITDYKLKAFILGIIPVKVKNQRMGFDEVDGKVYLKHVSTISNTATYLSEKLVKTCISESWKNRLGKYELVKNEFECKDCPIGDFSGYTYVLKENDGLIKVSVSGDSKEARNLFYVQQIDENYGVSCGIGRGAGYTFRFLENGNVYYNGFELKKVK